jgi:hypothetical protein
VSRFDVRFASEADAPGIRALFARVFGKELTAEEWSWKYAGNPDGWLGTVAIVDGEIVGNYSGCGMRFRIGGAERLTYAVGDVATHPRVRQLGHRGIFAEMVAPFYAEVERRGVAVCFGFPSDRALAISHRFAGTRDVLPIVERRVACETFPAAPPGFSFGDAVGEAFDTLWRSASQELPTAAVRDRARANWRFFARPHRYYRMLWREVSGAMTCWAALSVQGESALVADYLGLEPGGGDLPGLFAAAAAEAARLGARRLVFWETPGGPGAAVVARLSGENVPAGFTLAARFFDRDAFGLFASGYLAPALYDMV